jgi:hypothetical protein
MVARPADLGALVRAARAIVHGRVVATDVQASARTRVETLVTIEVASYLKGDLGPRVTFVVPGGTLGRYRTIASGVPQFALGEEVVLFLGARPPARPYVVRLAEGVFRIQHDTRSGKRFVTRHPIVGASPGWQRIARGAAGASPLTLAAFSALVNATLERQP